jgi:RecA-family ATPase
VVYGEWGSFKSWGLLSLALHIAAGQPWLGQYPIHSPRRVLYIDEEMSPRLLRRRVKRLAAGMDPQPETLPFRALSRRGLRLDAGGVKVLLADLARSGFDPQAVIVETFRRVLVGDENTAKDVTEFWRAVEPIIQAGKTLIVSHHMKKPQSRSRGAVRHRASGSTDVMSAADDALAFERAGKEGFTVEPVKCREAGHCIGYRPRTLGSKPSLVRARRHDERAK